MIKPADVSRPMPIHPVKPKQNLLRQSRQWHRWAGLGAGLFLLIGATSGIVLNYKQPIFAALGFEAKPGRPEKGDAANLETAAEFSTGRGLAALPVTLERALEIARAEWGDVTLERIEVKTEQGGTAYKLKRRGGAELWVNAATGAHFVKGEYERVRQQPGGEVVARATDWGKVLIDLHTGKIGGAFGKAAMSGAALLLIFLTGSGFYLWMKPLWSRRRTVAATAGRRNPPTENGKPPSAAPSAAA